MNILVIEDNEETLSFLEQALKDEGFSVDSAKDGESGMRKALIGNHDAIILDNMLPKKTGPEICMELRKKGKNSRILMLSVNDSPETKAKVLNLGADDYLGKPFSFEELLARLKALIRRPEKFEKEILKINNLILDSKGRIVKYKNKEIHLTPKEFSILEYFMRNRGRIISRMELLEHVWDMNADPFTNTVETHILNIRNKFGWHGKNCLLLTISGAGYKIM